jgi:HK97 family phage major capsid protein
MTAAQLIASAIAAAERRALLAGSSDDRVAALADADRALGDLAELRTRGAAMLPVLRASDPYRPGGRSWYADLYLRDVAHDDAAGRRLADAAAAAAAGRVLEGRDITTATLNGLVPPSYVAAGMVPAIRSARPVADFVTAPVPMPATGAEVILPRVTTAAAASAQSAQNVVPTESNPATTPATSSSVAYIAAVVDFSRQLFERATPETDVLVAVELRAALDAAIESQTINGAGSSGELAGLLSVSGATSTTATDPADSSAAGLLAVLAKHYAATATAGKQPPDVWVMAGRRLAWLFGKLPAATAPAWPFTDALPTDPPGTVCRLFHRPVLESGGVPLTLGTGTNEDRIITLKRGDAWLLESAPVVAFRELNVETVRCTVACYAALAHMRPAAVGIVAGTTLAQTL